MQKDFEKQIKCYIKKIKRNMKLLPNSNKQLMSDMENDIFDFIENENVTDFEKVLQRFGSPRDVLTVFANEEDMQILLKKLRIRKILSGVVISLFVIVLAIIVAIVVECFDPNGYFHSSVSF